jgi:hypothetical protein
MSSFLATTLATPAQPVPLGGVPSTKNLSTDRLAKPWIAVRRIHIQRRYTLSKQLNLDFAGLRA